MRRFRCVRVVVVFGLAAALVGVVPDEVSAVAARARPCRSTAFVANALSSTVSTIDVKTRTQYRTVIAVGATPTGVAITPDGKTAFVANNASRTVSTIDVKTRTKNPTDITVGSLPYQVAVTPDGKTAFVANNGSGTVSTIDVKTRKNTPPTSPSARTRRASRLRRTARPPSSPTPISAMCRYPSATRCRRLM
jgi:YVTN family beta-propeller protein